MDIRTYWVWLQNGMGIAARTSEALAAFESPEAMAQAGPTAWRLSGAFTPKQIQRLEQSRPEDARATVEQCDNNGWRLITPADADYPPLLRKLDNAPVVLYTWGDVSCLQNRLPVAMVGTRAASRYGTEVAGRLSASLAEAGAVIVSGGALGVDSTAHAGALFAKGKTIAVLGCGLAANYLMGNYPLRREIAQNGAVVSEYPPQTPALGKNFPVRNRLISGMSYGTVVIEAGERSGSLITASYALEQGRDVFAVPGDIINSAFTGANKLIRDGAKPVFSAADVLEDYAARFPHLLDLESLERVLPNIRVAPGKTGKPKRAPAAKPAPPPPPPPKKKSPGDNLSPDAGHVYDLFEAQPAHVDDLVRAAQWPASRVITALTELEIGGYIELTSGKRYALI